MKVWIFCGDGAIHRYLPARSGFRRQIGLTALGRLPMLICLLLVALLNAFAQPGKPITNKDVLEMIKAGLPESTIVLAIQKGPVQLDTSPMALVELKNGGATPKILDVVVNPGAGNATVSPVATNGNPGLEIGIYLKKSGDWMPIPPEIVNWKTGGTLKSIASAGVVKKDLNGNIDGPSSKTSVKTPVELLIVTAEGIAPEEYQLIRLRLNKDFREFRSVTGGILNQRSGAMRDLIPFEAKKSSPRQYILVIPPSLGAGEYGLLPPGAGGSSTTGAVSAQYGKMYTFHIVE
jgi:hypothetical protein